MTCFLIDDDIDDQEIFALALERMDMSIRCEVASDGVEALEKLRQSVVPHYIFLDLNMPGMLGLQALKEIKNSKKFASIPTIVLTTSTLPMDKKLSYEYGANCFLSKPSYYSDLVTITKMIARLYFHQWK